jgi:hypothetical protein
MNRIQKILIKRDNMSADEAAELITDSLVDLRDRLDNGDDIDDFMSEWFNLEPDHFDELLSMI